MLKRSNMNAQAHQDLSAPVVCDAQCTAVEFLDHPFSLQRDFQQGRPERTANMRPSLAPIEASACEPAPQRPRGLNVDAKGLKSLLSRRSEAVRVTAALRTGGQPAQCPEAVVEGYSHHTRQVIVASPCGAQTGWCVRHELIARAARKNAEPFERIGHVGPFQAVEAMLSLDEHFDQVRDLQSVQVCARG